MIGVAGMSLWETLGLRRQKPDPAPIMACVTDAVDHALEMHKEARQAIRQGNGNVTAMLNQALRSDTENN